MTCYALTVKNVLDSISASFSIPEKTDAKISFADTPDKISFEESRIALYGVPLDITTSFGKGTRRGPEALRVTSALQIETLIFEEMVDISRFKIFDLGDLNLPYDAMAPGADNITFLKLPSYNNDRGGQNKVTSTSAAVLSYLDRTIPQITAALYYNAQKLPILIGGEHTLSYYSIKALADEKPMIIHFDAHRDLKKEYENKKLCHTTPFYHLIREGHLQGKDLIQIGIRQSDHEENLTALQSGITTFDAWSIHDDIITMMLSLKELTKNRRIYISFDIDVYDLPYVPCTGTPEPFGLSPLQVIQILKSIDKSADLIGMDIVEVSAKADDYREGALATHTLYRILSRQYVKNKNI
jgi:agmatinase